jgi:hypothetical protein
MLIPLTFSTYTGCGGRDLKGTKEKPKNVGYLLFVAFAQSDPNLSNI